MKRRYGKRTCADKRGARELLAGQGQPLLPLVDVFVGAGHALDTIVDVSGRAAIEAVLEISAAEVAGPRQPGKRREEGGVGYHGRRRVVCVCRTGGPCGRLDPRACWDRPRSPVGGGARGDPAVLRHHLQHPRLGDGEVPTDAPASFIWSRRWTRSASRLRGSRRMSAGRCRMPR